MAPVGAGALASLEATPIGAGALTSTEVVPVAAGTSVSLKASPAGVQASTEAVPTVATDSAESVKELEKKENQVHKSSRKITLNTKKEKFQKEAKPMEKIQKGTQPVKSNISQVRNKK